MDPPRYAKIIKRYATTCVASRLATDDAYNAFVEYAAKSIEDTGPVFPVMCVDDRPHINMELNSILCQRLHAKACAEMRDDKAVCDFSRVPFVDNLSEAANATLIAHTLVSEKFLDSAADDFAEWAASPREEFTIAFMPQGERSILFGPEIRNKKYEPKNSIKPRLVVEKLSNILCEKFLLRDILGTEKCVEIYYKDFYHRISFSAL